MMKWTLVIFSMMIAVYGGGVEFPRIPYIRRLKMPTFDDFIKQQNQIKKDNEINSWIHH